MEERRGGASTAKLRVSRLPLGGYSSLLEARQLQRHQESSQDNGLVYYTLHEEEETVCALRSPPKNCFLPLPSEESCPSTALKTFPRPSQLPLPAYLAPPSCSAKPGRTHRATVTNYRRL